ncbi:MAG: dienelactone hydrolase family protein [Burkholderiales bacterium]|nr:dienelactone hydrolase family protein [Burkholderiales bacterium]MCE7877705.1 dienelactone hydrolase family protein [Betaproteobacteria bacterium PRO3]
MGHWVELAAADGARIAAWRSEPSAKPRGGLVVVQEIFGVNRHIRAVCDGFAADGYLAIAPALFDRIRPGVELGYTGDDVAQGRDFKARSPIESALADVAAARDVAAAAGKVGIVGYCWGGYVAWMSAARLTGFACAIPYYGGGMLEAVGEKPRCPVLAHFGEQDPHIPVEGVRKFAAAHPAAKVEIYAANHGFNCDHRGSHHPQAAALARERTLAFLREYVG